MKNSYLHTCLSLEGCPPRKKSLLQLQIGQNQTWKSASIDAHEKQNCSEWRSKINQIKKSGKRERKKLKCYSLRQICLIDYEDKESAQSKDEHSQKSTSSISRSLDQKISISDIGAKRRFIEREPLNLKSEHGSNLR